MFDHRSFHGCQAPPVQEVLDEKAMKVLACRVLHVPESELSVLFELRVVVHQLSPGRYAYVRFHENCEMELFLPRDCNQNPRRVPC
jgi:hypothetical protein